MNRTRLSSLGPLVLVWDRVVVLGRGVVPPWLLGFLTDEVVACCGRFQGMPHLGLERSAYSRMISIRVLLVVVMAPTSSDEVARRNDDRR
jgi:hypothetical protein